MIPDAVVPGVVVGQFVALVVAASVLWWRMANAEKDIQKVWDHYEKEVQNIWNHHEKLVEKVESLNGPRLERIELEQLRSRDRLHKLEGISSAVEYLVTVLDPKKEKP